MSSDLSVKLEILRMAREIVANEYTDKRAQDHNKWLAESERNFAMKGQRLPYPDIPPHPNEEAVIAKAKSLLEFVGIGQDRVVEEVPAKKVEAPAAQSPTPPIEKVKAEPVDDQNFNYSARDYVRSRIADRNEEDYLTSSKILPDLYRQIDELRSKIGRL
jgi:hypothetical protein